jgi:hypothetical protein
MENTRVATGPLGVFSIAHLQTHSGYVHSMGFIMLSTSPLAGSVMQIRLTGSHRVILSSFLLRKVGLFPSVSGRRTVTDFLQNLLVICWTLSLTDLRVMPFTECIKVTGMRRPKQTMTRCKRECCKMASTSQFKHHWPVHTSMQSVVCHRLKTSLFFETTSTLETSI